MADVLTELMEMDNLACIVVAGESMVGALGNVLTVYSRYYEQGINNNSIDRLAQASAGNMIGIAALFTEIKNTVEFVALHTPTIKDSITLQRWMQTDDALRTYFCAVQQRQGLLKDTQARQQLFTAIGWEYNVVPEYQDLVVSSLLHIMDKNWKESFASTIFHAWLHQ